MTRTTTEQMEGKERYPFWIAFNPQPTTTNINPPTIRKRSRSSMKNIQNWSASPTARKLVLVPHPTTTACYSSFGSSARSLFWIPKPAANLLFTARRTQSIVSNIYISNTNNTLCVYLPLRIGFSLVNHHHNHPRTNPHWAKFRCDSILFLNASSRLQCEFMYIKSFSDSVIISIDIVCNWGSVQQRRILWSACGCQWMSSINQFEVWLSEIKQNGRVNIKSSALH